MADTSINVSPGTSSPVAVDFRTEVTNGDARQVVVIGDPSVNAGVAPVDATKGVSVNVYGRPFSIQGIDFQRPANTTAYAAGDVWTDSTTSPTSGGFTFSNVVSASGASALITDLKVCSDNSAGGLNADLILFSASVTMQTDNAAFAITDAEAKTIIGKIPFYLEGIGNNAFYHSVMRPFIVTPTTSANLRALIRVRSAYTPANAERLTMTLSGFQID